MRSADPRGRGALVRLVYGYMASQMIHVAVRLGVFDLVREAPRTDEELAGKTGTHPPSLLRLLRALASLGLLTEVEPRRFGPAGTGTRLESGAADGLNAITRLFCSPEFWASWGNLQYSIETGKPAFELVHGMSFFTYLERHEELAATFNDAMAENASFEAPRFVAGYDFSRFSRIVDVGGGNGSLLLAILARYPDLRGVVFETPPVAAEARATVAAAGLVDRCAVVEGDFFEKIPVTGDAFLVKSVVHNWDDDRCVALLRTCRAAMPPEAALLVLEPVLPAVMESAVCVETVMSDLNMLALTAGGFERSEADFRRLFTRAGLALVSISPTIEATDFRVIEARVA
ncbi:methyltransferase [Nonomuraea typhae]|uniref:Methyltransferase n=1 Tax=Nonomuraea typhae TaxID=2603600 RepID=A0ABW7YQ61_9ACTN